MHLGSCRHTIHDHARHHAWDRSLAPALEVDAGDTIEFGITDASGGQLSATSTARDVPALDFARVNPVTGPVFVRGAKSGDVLEVEILEFGMSGWGWTAIIPGFGLLAEHFGEPWLKHWTLTPGAATAEFADGIHVPLAPFPGTIGVAPSESGAHSIIPPRAWGGNLDVKHLTAGTKLYLPVGVEGALFSVGDTHAAQGDGEVCGTAIESPMRFAARLRVRRDLNLRRPAFETFGAAPGDRATRGSFVTTGVADDLMTATKQAIGDMVDHLTRTARLSAEEAYALASVAVDVRVHEVVDAPNWVVGAWLPHGIVQR